MIYLAPLQGFTDYVFRKAYAEIFSGIDAFFIPYISVKNHQILKKYMKEVHPENNLQNKIIPQVLVKDKKEILFLSNYLADLGYTEINLNMGCPYPMVTNRRKGSGLLPNPNTIAHILTEFFEKSSLKLSVKLRAGLEFPNEIEKVIPILNQFPLSEVILHPRIAKQLYKGEIIEDAFQLATEELIHELVYNGDIFTIDDFEMIKSKFPKTDSFMLGRGVLMNPFLPSEIKGIVFTEKERLLKLNEFHEKVLQYYLSIMDNEGNVLNKMKQFWMYFSYNFPKKKKVFKSVKKSKSLSDLYRIATDSFANY